LSYRGRRTRLLRGNRGRGTLGTEIESERTENMRLNPAKNRRKTSKGSIKERKNC
jgi:hypothetical protein